VSRSNTFSVRPVHLWWTGLLTSFWQIQNEVYLNFGTLRYLNFASIDAIMYSGIVDTNFSIYISAPPSNSDVINSASNVNQLTALEERVSALETTQTTTTTEITTLVTTVETLSAFAGTSTSSQFLTFTGSTLSAVGDYAGNANLIFNVSGSPGPLSLTLDLSGIGILSTNSATLTPMFQDGYIQIMWPIVGGETHTVSVASPFILVAGGTTIDMSATNMIIRRYVIAPIYGVYTDNVQVQQAAFALYIY